MNRQKDFFPCMQHRIFFFISILCISAGIIFGMHYVYAAGPIVVPANTLPEAIQKKVGFGKTIFISGWAWNSALGWIAQRTIVDGKAYGVSKNGNQEIKGWSWSSNYGWICWGKTCNPSDASLDEYGGKKPIIATGEEEPDVNIETIQTFPIFGDNKVEGIEQCDHGEGSTGNGNDGMCGEDGKGVIDPNQAICGNGIKEGAEQCDDGDFDDTNACNPDCTQNRVSLNSCGDGIVDASAGEECDDGDKDNTNACKNDCTSSGNTVKKNEYTFQLKGWAKTIALKDEGWISLQGNIVCNGCEDNGKKYGVTYDPDNKEFRGWAWSPKFGWIVFSGATLYSTTYRYAEITFAGTTEKKIYDVLSDSSRGLNKFKIDVSKADGTIREYQLDRTGSATSYTYTIEKIIEFKIAGNTVSNLTEICNSDSTCRTIDTVDVFDKLACIDGCSISVSASGRSTWKTQLTSPWVQTVGGNVFSRKGFGGTSAGGKNTQYLMYSGGITLADDLREGEKLELSCCTNDIVNVTKIGKPQILVSTVYSDLAAGGEVQIVKQQGKIKKRSGASLSDAASDVNTAFFGLLDGEERRLKKNGGDVEVRTAYPVYASLAQADTGMNGTDSIVVQKVQGMLKKDDGNDLSSQLKTALSSQKRIVGVLTNWTSDCDDATKQCSPVGRKKGLDIIKADALKRDTRPDVAFPQKIGNIRRNTLGSLRIDQIIQLPTIAQTKNTHGYKTVSINNEQGILDVMTAGLDDTVFVKDGSDLSIGSNTLRTLFEFKNGTSGKTGRGTIIVNGGNLYIYRPIQYESGTVSDIKNLASVAWIVLEKNGHGGDIIFDACIPPTSRTIKMSSAVSITQDVASVAGVFFAEGTISTGRGDASECGFTDDVPLYVNGMLIARKFNFQRVYSGDPDLNTASEFIQDTGRAVANTPPGLTDILKSLPVW